MTERTTLQETVSLQEYRDRACAIASEIEDLVVGMAPELRIAEPLLALHIVRRQLERALRGTALTPEQQALLLEQVEEQRVSFDQHFAGLADQAKAGMQ